MLFSKGINFQGYLNDYFFWKNTPIRSRKAFKTALLVLYGKKKDREHIKKKYKKCIEDYKKSFTLIKEAIYKKSPMLANFVESYAGPYILEG